MAPARTYGVLGPLEARVDGRSIRLGGPRQRAVLAVLVLRAGHVVPASVLVDAVWGDEPPDSAGNLLQGYVSALRRELGRDAVETTGAGYRLQCAPDAVDVSRFERAATDGGAALDAGHADEAVRRLADALALWRGPALADVTAAGTLTAAARLEELRLAAQERHAEALIASGAARAAVAELEVLVAQHPLREGPLALLMRALYRCGRQADALAAYRHGREVLVGELGIEPGAALRELEAAILRQDPALGGGDAVWADTAAPEHLRTVLVAALDRSAARDLAALVEPLAHGTPPRELVVATTVPDATTLAAASAALHDIRATLAGRGATVRAAAFTSLTPGADLARLAAEQDAELVVVDAPEGLLEDGRLVSLLRDAPCDVAVRVPGTPGSGPVLVAFSGAEHDWAAVELGAWFSRRTGRPLRLAGALVGRNGRDASRMLADASLAVQRALGVAAEPLLVEPDPVALVEAARGAGLVVVGLTERWRHEGLGRARTALATAGDHPTLLVRRGLRPGGLAPRTAGTRFTWTLTGL